MSARMPMHRHCSQFLARAGFAGDEHRRVGQRGLAQRSTERAHRGALADHPVEAGFARRVAAFAGEARHAVRVADHRVEHRFRTRQREVVVAVVADEIAHRRLVELARVDARDPADIARRQRAAELGQVLLREALAQIEQRRVRFVGIAVEDAQHAARIRRTAQVPAQLLQATERKHASGATTGHVDQFAAVGLRRFGVLHSVHRHVGPDQVRGSRSCHHGKLRSVFNGPFDDERSKTTRSMPESG
jgi:hypothetical protein